MTVGGVGLPALTLDYAQIRESSGGGGNFDGYTTGNNDLTGMWGGKFYGNGASVIDHPGSVAGTFGASRFLNSPVPFESFIGAFAAYKE